MLVSTRQNYRIDSGISSMKHRAIFTTIDKMTIAEIKDMVRSATGITEKASGQTHIGFYRIPV